ncbi:unnamed protein product, partial [Polarella glacialis]
DSLDFSSLAFPLVHRSFMTGILAAMCGIGGGLVMGPILVELRVPPAISSATTATTLLVLSSSTCIVYLCRDVAPHDYAPYLCAVTAAGAFTGKKLVGWWVARTGQESFIVWVLVVITVLSAALTPALGIARLVEAPQRALAIGQLCHPETADG